VLSLAKNTVVALLIVVVQFSSFGLLINKHYCNGKLTETSLLLANKGCDKSVSVADRFFHRIHDCHPTTRKPGVQKKSCCDFASVYEKISVYNQPSFAYAFFGVAYVQQVETIWQPNWFRSVSEVVYYDRGPPDVGVSILELFCVLLI
jgi:hypothetical protein